ncbi:MAG TPA: ClcB-like voltage-gated chloride channel protein, partial [Verrucomicrobiae bacterium]|jgi:CIC family chloride channel protein|nr:ClcB-like voltage-gated chloride channel protein [Verrucomicrobiae bacterium]
LLKRLWNFLHHHWRGALEWRGKIVFREETLHLLMAGIIGFIGGSVNLFFFYAGEMVQRLFLPRPIDPVQAAETFGILRGLAVPTLGGLAAGLILYLGFRLVGPQGSSDLLEVVVAGDGRLPSRTEFVKTASALVSIATGASIGREGGITQLSATLASKLGQIAKWPPYRLRLLVGCGAAAGISAAYNAPIAGAVFASLIILGNFSMNSFAPLVCASVVAAMVSRSFFGIAPWYHVPPFPSTAPLELPWFIVMGVLCGGVSALFLKFLGAAKERFNQLGLPIYLRLALAGLVVGLIAVGGFPGVCGNGYFVTNAILNGDFERTNAIQQLGGLFLAKLLATAIVVGAGTVGGVFTPTMFLGADAGALFGMALHHFGCATDVPSGAFALAGMGATLAGTTKSPLLAIIMAFEISLNFALMPPLMLACVVATLVSRQLHGESIYTEHLRLKGLSPLREQEPASAGFDLTVGDLMLPPVPPMRETASVRKIAERFLASSNNFLPIVDGQQRLVGVIALQDLKEFLHDHEKLAGVIAMDLMRPLPQCLTPRQRLLDALPVALASELRNIPVVNTASENRLVGSLSRAELLAIFSEAIAKKSKLAG